MNDAIDRDLGRLARLSPEARLAALRSSNDGLSHAESLARLAAFGSNDPVRPERTRPLLRFASNFTHTLALLLWFAAGLSFAAGIPELGAAIVAVVVVNGVFAYIQEHRAERVVAGLMRRVAVRARVLRDGAETVVPAAELVPGDVIRLSAGDVIPADCVLLAADALSLDLSMITGESKPVARDAGSLKPDASALRASDVSCVGPAGAGVVTGTATGVVYATGPESTVGQVASLVESVRRGESVLESQVATLSRVTAVIAVLAGAATLSLAAASTDVELLAALTFATGVIVALVPEGLLPTLSVSLAIGAARMAGRGAAIRRLSAVEAVGSVTVICTDKTGTLTENALAVVAVEPVSEDGEFARDAMLAAALCGDARRSDGAYAGDPIDVALAKWVATQGRDVEESRKRYPRTEDVAFDAQRRYMAVTCEIDGAARQFIKGAPEAVGELCGVPPSGAMDRRILDATRAGERVILLAAGAPDARPMVVGLVRLEDPPRAEVPAAIAACRRAGVRVIMLTGDHPETARAVAAAIGLATASREVLDGREMDALSDAALLDRLRDNAICARIDPAQKLRITSLLRRSGEIVVVTGDGINDAPALRAADVGVAMGRRGTEVAKQASDIVLADDNFATIVAAIEEGRSIKENIRRFVSYVFTSNVAELAPFVLYVFLPVPLPLAVAQVLAIDLGTDLLPAMALGADPPSPRTMDRTPEPPERPLLTGALAIKTFLFFGLLEAALGMASFFAFHLAHGWRPFDALDASSDARTLTFLGIVSGQIGCLFAQRDGPLLHRLAVRGNSLIGVGLAVEVALALVLVYVPGLNGLFSMSGVSPGWLLVLPAGAAVFLAIDQLRRAVMVRMRGA